VVSDFASFKSLSRILSVIQKATGAKLNRLKSKGLRLGGWRHRQLPFEASWVDDAIKINGIWFGYGEPEHRTWAEKVDLVEAKLQDFSGRWLSLPGKATVVNRFVYPLLWYPGTVFDIPARIIVKLERAIFGFIWSGKTELVKRRIVYSEPHEGGLGVVHLLSKLRFLLLKCVIEAVDKPTLPFAFFVRYWAGLCLRRWYPQLFTNLEPHSDKGTGAYRQIKDTLCRVTFGGDFLGVSGERSGVLYGRLLNALCPLPVAPGRLTSFPEVWRSVNCRILDSSLRDLSWRIAHDALVTNLRRYRWRLSDGVCPRGGCGKMESVPHLFWQCAHVRVVWEWVQALVDRVTGQNQWALSEGYALYGLSPPASSAGVRQVLLFLIASVRRQIWRSRCGVVFRGEVGSTEAILSSVKGEVRLRVEADFVRLSGAAFKRRWCFGGCALIRLRNGSPWVVF
jgi:hypothetical protein